jgi:hypothetical protein
MDDPMDIDQGNKEPESEWCEISIKRFEEANQIEKAKETWNEDYKKRLAERVNFLSTPSKR